MSTQGVKLKVSKPTAECIGPDAPKDMKMLAASGKLPVEPDELLIALYILSNDKDRDISGEAKKSIFGIPLHILKPILLSEKTHPKVIQFVSLIFSKKKEVLEAVITGINSEIKTLLRITERADLELLGFISEQNEVIIKNPLLFDAIKNNKAVTAQIIVKVGAILESTPDNKEGEGNPPEELIKEKSEGESDEEKEEGSLYSQILVMGVSQKIKLAITGNKEARSLLVKEPNRLICGNVIKNPRITDSEAVLYSASKSVGEEVFRGIAANKDWMKKYEIKFNLVSNPRVPLPMAMNLLKHIRAKDLEMISKSRNVSRGVSNMAKRLLDAQKKAKERK